MDASSAAGNISRTFAALCGSAPPKEAPPLKRDRHVPHADRPGQKRRGGGDLTPPIAAPPVCLWTPDRDHGTTPVPTGLGLMR